MIGGVTDRQVVRALLAQADVRPSKRLGQNFLVDADVLAEIERALRQAAPTAILEIGSGLGAVTEVLLRVASEVVAVEVDRRLARVLLERLAGRTSLRVRIEDVLQIDLANEFDRRVHVVGSLPYRISAPILKWIIAQRDAVSGALLITQREVAEKIAASPGKDGSALGVFVQAYTDVEIMRRIGRTSFHPVPEVDSALWRLTPLERPRFASGDELFFKTVRALYGARRKMLRRALRDLVAADRVDSILSAARLTGDVRGETLSFHELDRLVAAVEASTQGGV